jgi:voltage-gated potassium channel
MDADERSPLVGRHRPFVERALFGRAITPGRAATIIAGASLLLTASAGVAARLLDKNDFASLRDAMWWALQTVTTVGYGDVVPHDTVGRLIGAILMLNGIALLTVVTAGVTAMLIEQSRRRRSTSDDPVLARLERIESRLSELSSRLPPGRPPD